MLRQLALASFILLAPSVGSAETSKFRIEEATIEAIQAAIQRGESTSTQVVQLYLTRIKAYNGTCVEQPDGVLGAGPIKPIKNAHQRNALMTLNLRQSKREKLGFDGRKARSMTDPVDDSPAMPDALEVAAQQDAYFASNGKLIGLLHGIVFSIKDQYDTLKDLRWHGRADSLKQLRGVSAHGPLPSAAAGAHPVCAARSWRCGPASARLGAHGLSKAVPCRPHPKRLAVSRRRCR